MRKRLSVLLALGWFAGAAGLAPSVTFAQSGQASPTGSATPVATALPADDPKAVAPSPAGPPQSPSGSGIPQTRRAGAGWPSPRFGLGLRGSSLGAGAEIATLVNHWSNLRVGFNAFGYKQSFTNDGVAYVGHIRFQSVELHYDWFPFAGKFHLSPGLLAYNGNRVTLNASVPGGQTFTLGGVTYLSSPSDPIAGSGTTNLKKVAPEFLAGWGNLVPRGRERLTFSIEVGAAYQGSPGTALNLKGTICDPSGIFCRDINSDPTVQSNLQAEQANLNHNMRILRFYPVASFGIGFRF